MNEKVQKALKDDEVLLWSDKPEKFDTKDKTNKNTILTTIIASFSIAVAVSYIYLNAALSKCTDPKWVLVAILFVVASYISYNKLAISRKVATKLTYVITNQRIFTLTEGSTEFSGAYYPEIKEAKFFTDADGHTSLLCGSKAVRYPASKIRFEATTKATRNDKKETEAYVMYAIPEADKVREIIADYLPIVK